MDGAGGDAPPFLVSLIDHKSLVDYDVPMQLLRYMVAIWHEYRLTMEREKEGCTQRKGFRYPAIIPVVYYEGTRNWTADRHLGGRVGQHAEFGEWIPDFKYELVRIHDYSNEELLERNDEMSLIMLFNKVQDAEGLEEFLRIPPEEINRIVRDSPGHVLDAIATVMDSLCFKIGASEEERIKCVRKVRNRNVGYLFENAEHMSLVEERQKTADALQRADEADRRADEEHRRADEADKRAEAERAKREEMEEKLRAAEELLKKQATHSRQDMQT